jgi:hypothetical protein
MSIQPAKAYLVRDGALVPLKVPFATVTPGETPPTANNDSFTTPYQTPAVVQVLGNDSAGSSAIDPASVQVVQQPAAGSAGANSNGTISYTPPSGFSGNVSFSYRVADITGLYSNTAIVTGTVETSSGGGTGGLGTPLPPITGVLRNVSNGTELSNALAAYNPGDHIVLANGTYPDSYAANRDGNSSQPVVIRAANLLGATVGKIDPNGAHIIIYGLNITTTTTAPGNSRAAPFVKFWRCKFTGSTSPNTNIMLRTYNAPDIDIAYCEFTGHAGRGIALNPINGCRRGRIRKCWFHDQAPPGTLLNSMEAIQVGFGGGSGSGAIDHQTTIELNLFERWANEAELISVKSSSNIVRRNTVRQCQWITNRNGTNNRYEANSMFDSHGIENFDGTPGTGPTTVPGNVWLNNSTVTPTNNNRIFAGNITAGQETSVYPASRRCILSANSFANATLIGYQYSGATWPYPAESTRIRQHSGTITLQSLQANTDSQPSQSETEYTWLSRLVLEASDVGPFADLVEEPGTGPATVVVSSKAAMESAYASAAAGAIIEVQNGTSITGTINLNRSFSEGAPVVIRAASYGGVVMPPSVQWIITGSHNIIRDFVFEGSSAAPASGNVRLGGTGSMVRRCRFNTKGGTSVIGLNGSSGKVLHCEFSSSDPSDSMQANTLAVANLFGGGNENGGHNVGMEVAYCYFHDLPAKPGTSGSDYGLRSRGGFIVGRGSPQARTVSNTHLHHCLFQDCGNCRISLNASGNRVEFCTITGKTGNILVTRHTDFGSRFGINNTFRGCWSENAMGYMLTDGTGNKAISCVSINGGGSFEVFRGSDDNWQTVGDGVVRAIGWKLSDCEGPLVVGFGYSAYTYPARDTRIEGHAGPVSEVSGYAINTVQTSQITESLSIPVKITPSMVGPLA